MARFLGYLIPVSGNPIGGASARPNRAFALVAIVALLAGALSPGWALAAAEPESEGEGTSAPGLQSPSFEPGGEETALEGVLGAEMEGVEAEGALPPVGTEPPEPAEGSESPPPPAASAVEPSEQEPPPAAPTAQAAPPAEYEGAIPPSYEPFSSEPSAPVENATIVAPPGGASKPSAASVPSSASPEAVLEAPAPPSERSAPPSSIVPAATPPESVPSGPGRLALGSSYTVRAGDCLWSIAAALLPADASNSEIAAKVTRLWQLNKARIGTGDPNVLLVGTELQLA